MKRAQFATIVAPYLPDSEAINEGSESAHANCIGVGFFLLLADIRSCIVVVKPLAEAENDYRSVHPFALGTDLPSRSLYRDRAQRSSPQSHPGSLGRIRRIQGTHPTRSITPS